MYLYQSRRDSIICLFICFFATLVLSYLLFLGKVYGHHIDGRKFAVLSPNVEIKGIVAAVHPNNDIFITPDSNYGNLLLGGNKIAPTAGDESYHGWKEVQDNLINCNLDSSSYPTPHPIMRLETYGIGIRYPPSENGPPAYGNGVQVKVCDHIRITGLYVIDYGHTMYDGASGAYCYHPGIYDACHAHSELHPYNMRSIELVNPLKVGDTNYESHTIVLPFYNDYYYENWFGNRPLCLIPNTAFPSNIFVPCLLSSSDHRGRVVDGAKTLGIDTEWFIEAPPKPTNDCSGGCELNVQEVPGQESGHVTVCKKIEPNGLRVHVQASAPNSADYLPDSQPNPYSNDHNPFLYSLENPTVFQTLYSVKWIPKLSNNTLHSIVGVSGYYGVVGGWQQHVIVATTDGKVTEIYWKPGEVHQGLLCPT